MSKAIASKGMLSEVEQKVLKDLLERSKDSTEDDWGRSLSTRSQDVLDQVGTVEKDITKLITIFGPHVVCAGGAPRNWYFNKEARDFDYYILTPLVIHDDLIGIKRSLVDCILSLGYSASIEEVNGNGGDCGYSDPHIKYVLRASFGGTERDFIFLKWNVKACVETLTANVLPYAKFVVDNFGCSISETVMYPVWNSKWRHGKYHFEFYRTPRFNRSVMMRVIMMRATSTKYKLKLQSYFEGWDIRKEFTKREDF